MLKISDELYIYITFTAIKKSKEMVMVGWSNSKYLPPSVPHRKLKIIFCRIRLVQRVVPVEMELVIPGKTLFKIK